MRRCFPILQFPAFKKCYRYVEQDFQELFENANDLIQSIGSAGRILFVNRVLRYTLGYAEKEIGRLSMMDLVPPELLEQSIAVLADVLLGKSRRSETVFLASDGWKIYMV
ncbi:MAG: PAS domain S-box protein [Nitrospirota bacterium]